MNDIFEKMKSEFEYYTHIKLSGLLNALGATLASRLSEYSDKLRYVIRQAFVTTADKEYLFLHSGSLVELRESDVAKGYVRFTGEVGTPIPSGLELMDSNNYFKTTNSGVIGLVTLNTVVSVVDGIASINPDTSIPSCYGLVNGNSRYLVSSETGIEWSDTALSDGDLVIVSIPISGLVAVKCTVEGEVGNRELSAQLKLTTTLAGINNEVGVVNISGGIDEEDVEAYRSRVLTRMRSPVAPFNVNHIKEVAGAIVKYVWVKGGNGSVNVIVMNENKTISPTELTKVTTAINEIKPAYLAADKVSVTTPLIENVDIQLTGLVPNTVGMKSEILKNLVWFFDQDKYETNIDNNQLYGVLYSTKYLGESLKQVTIVSESVEAVDNTYYTLGNVSYV